MLHPSYADLMAVANENTEDGAKVVNSRYSIVLAASKRARQLVDNSNPLVEASDSDKPLSIAIKELEKGKIKILGEE